MAKWVAAVFFAAGLALIVRGLARDTSFEDGTFLVAIVEVIAGGVMVVSSFIAFCAMLLFKL